MSHFVRPASKNNVTITHFTFFFAERLLVVPPVDFVVFRVGFLLNPNARLTGFSALPARLTSFEVDSETDSAASPTVLRILAIVVFLRPVVDLVELFLDAIAVFLAGNRPDSAEGPEPPFTGADILVFVPIADALVMPIARIPALRLSVPPSS